MSKQAGWQHCLQQSIRDPRQLVKQLELSPDCVDAVLLKPQFPLLVPPAYLAKMKKGDPNDPLLRQVLALKQELVQSKGFGTDPVGDNAAQKSRGVLHKYQGRVLLLATEACAIHCRYCFRQHFEYEGKGLNNPEIFDYIQADSSIHEVILSGGDPLVLSDRRLSAFLQKLEKIDHVQRVRVHSRIPIVLPQRITTELCSILSSSRFQIVFVIHANHPNEIDTQVGMTLQQLVKQGMTVLNQTVLLKHVNDDVDTLIQLNEKLFQYQTLPYYLHVLDKVQGASHFDVSEDEALTLLDMLRRRLPGYLVPKLVKEIAGQPYKQPLG